MKLLALAALVMLIVSCSTQMATKPAASTTATPAPKLTLASAHAKLMDDSNKAIARAQGVVDACKASSALQANDPDCIYAPRRIECYTTIQLLAPAIPDISNAGGAAGGPIEAFEVGAELVEKVAEVADFSFSPVQNAQFQTSCGWIVGRGADILNKLGVKAGRAANGAAVLIPKLP